MITKKEKDCIWKACEEYKEKVHCVGPDGTTGLNDKYSVEDFYNCIVEKFDEFKKRVLEDPFFEELNAKSIVEVYDQSYALFMYCLQDFINRNLNDILKNIPVVDLMDDSHSKNLTEKENKKEFIKEVMEGIERKKYLKEFFDDLTSYKQFRTDIEHCLLYMNWERIHRVMKKLKWVWHHWEDEQGDIHEGTTPSTYGIREFAIDMINKMEEYVEKHPDADRYLCECGGFELDIWVCDPDKDTDPDDYNHRVRFVLRFVAEQYDNGM